MTIENMLSQIGTGTKHLNERYHAEYGPPAHDPHVYYAYEPSSTTHEQMLSSKHNYGGGGHKSNAAMSALTLLAFLFFLNILQQCLKEHMTAMSTPQFMIVTGGREGEEQISKTSESNKIGKHDRKSTQNNKDSVNEKNKINENENNPFKGDASDKNLLKVNTAEHLPENNGQKYIELFKRQRNKISRIPGFVNAMYEDQNPTS